MNASHSLDIDSRAFRAIHGKEKYLVHHRPQGAALPKEGWEASSATTAWGAIKEVLERPHNIRHRPTKVYVSKGNLRHPDGTPMIVQAHRIEWGEAT